MSRLIWGDSFLKFFFFLLKPPNSWGPNRNYHDTERHCYFPLKKDKQIRLLIIDIYRERERERERERDTADILSLALKGRVIQLRAIKNV